MKFERSGLKFSVSEATRALLEQYRHILGHGAPSPRLRCTGIVPVSLERHQVDRTDAAASDVMCEELQKATVSSTPPRTQTALDGTTLSPCYSHHVYKLLHGYLNLPAEEFFEPPAAGHLRGHNFKVRQPRFHLARRKAAFAVHSAGPWNRLPSHIAEAPTVSNFKNRLDANWCSVFPDIV